MGYRKGVKTWRKEKGRIRTKGRARFKWKKTSMGNMVEGDNRFTWRSRGKEEQSWEEQEVCLLGEQQ